MRGILLIGRPIVVGGLRPLTSSSATEARALGVRAGMPTLRARALLQLVHPRQPRPLYRHYSPQVIGILTTITPAANEPPSTKHSST